MESMISKHDLERCKKENKELQQKNKELKEKLNRKTSPEMDLVK